MAVAITYGITRFRVPWDVAATVLAAVGIAGVGIDGKRIASTP